jgi:outer membrane cobalamin receptor
MIYILTRRFVLSLWLGAGIAVALLLGSGVAGQCAADSNAPGLQARGLAEMSIEDLMNITVVTAGKKPETIAKTAAAVFVITRDDIERYGYQTLTQALRRISGFYSETDRYIDFVGLRGYLPNSDLNRRVLVLVDGHKVNDYLYGQAPVDQDLPVDMQDIERIEVVKGPGSALWGSEALLCVINCITKTASEVDGLEMRQDMGFRAGQHLAYGRSLPGGLQISGTISGLESSGQRKIYFPEFDSPTTNNGVAVGLDGERVGRGFLNMSRNGLRVVYDHVKRVKDVPTGYWWGVFNAPGQDVTDERHYWEMSYENPTPYAGDGKLLYRVYQDQYDGICNWNGQDDPDSPIYYTRNIDVARAWGTEARYSRNISSHVSAILGAEYMQAKAERSYVHVDPYTPPNPPRIRHSGLLSYYMQTDWDVSTSLRFVAGTRMDNYKFFGSNWSPRLGLIHKASPKSTLKLLYGEAFRAPSMSETGGDDNAKDLHPEKIRTTELVWDQQAGENGRLVTSLFAYDMYDVMLMTPEWDTIIGSITGTGIETQYDYRLRNGGSGYFGLSVVDAKSGDPSFPLPSSPRLVASCGLSIPVFKNKAYLATDLQYVSSRKTMGGNTVDGAAIANLTLTSHSLVKGSDVSLGIWNLFNTQTSAASQLWNEEGSGVFVDQIPQGERTIQLQVSRRL